MPRAIVVPFVLAAACVRPAPDAPIAPSEPAAPVAARREPAPEPVFDGPPSPEVLAYVTDCNHVIEVPDDVEGNPVSECDAVPFDQNCAPDPSGCWDAGRECLSACTPGCDLCQSSCASTCDTCKAGCPSGSQGCLRACAEDRASCRTTCMSGWSTCLDACPEEEQACNAAFEAQVAERCPDCDDIGTCQMTHDGEEGTPPCDEQFPEADAVCFQWCHGY